ncbi:splicing regulator NSRP1-like domain-containing protein [Aspergillus candidus]|uniref:Coiled-coil domain-containing protein 55-domain containing protein n=1 Tax=Aspergillus candidus TaxID=41067 RepID=A0A2I2FBY3_ASPCN|nr:coiled-coil domain-containing protein 55-domain containing protein [Aspergillus candidus]PLB38131.1 coiled-coil domain-containing protein 55-domain containing protein [Aspergillus candidus]
MPPKLSLGLNLPGKKPPGARPPPSLGQKRKKTIFDDDSDEDAAAESKGSGDNAVEITSIGGLEEPVQPAPSTKSPSTAPPPAKRKIPFGQQAAAKPSAKPLNKSSIFADDDDDDDNTNNTSEQLDKNTGVQFGLNPSKPSTAEYTNLSALHSSRKHAQQAEDLDPSIYSYDAVYDSLQAAKPQKNKKKDGAEGEEEVPRYMTSLLRSAEVRKRDQLRARDRMLAKEREAEGDEFADKEKFVTAAYKAQQEEMRRVEQEEAEKERAEAERRKKNGDVGMLGFYRDVLSRGEEEHAAAMRAADEAAKRVKEGVAGTEEEEEARKEASKEKTEAQVAAELNARGARVAVNDEGSVVDKRQLLSAGLNVAPKPKAAPSAAPGGGAARPAAKARVDGAPASGRAGQRARQTEMIAAQLEKQAQEEAAAEAAKQKELEERSRSRKSGTDVSSARERFLARKKEREAAAKGK